MDDIINKELPDRTKLIFGIKNDMFYLLITLGSLLFLPAFIPLDIDKNSATYLLLTMVSITGVLSLSTTWLRFYLGLGISLICFLLSLIDFVLTDPGMIVLIRIIGFILLLTYIAYGILERISKANHISMNIWYGSIAGYLLMGILGGFWCFMLDFFYPGSFALPAGSVPTINTMAYFSFVTMTTVGYGEITPETDPARAIALFIAIVGQMYVTINVAILVSKYMSSRQ